MSRSKIGLLRCIELVGRMFLNKGEVSSALGKPNCMRVKAGNVLNLNDRDTSARLSVWLVIGEVLALLLISSLRLGRRCLRLRLLGQKIATKSIS